MLIFRFGQSNIANQLVALDFAIAPHFVLFAGCVLHHPFVSFLQQAPLAYILTHVPFSYHNQIFECRLLVSADTYMDI